MPVTPHSSLPIGQIEGEMWNSAFKEELSRILVPSSVTRCRDVQYEHDEKMSLYDHCRELTTMRKTMKTLELQKQTPLSDKF